MKIRIFIYNLLYAFFALVESFLALRFILKLFGASVSNGFVSWIYEMSAVLLDPFRDIFPVRVFQNTYVFEFSTLFAILMYAIGTLLVFVLLDTITTPIMKKGK